MIMGNTNYFVADLNCEFSLHPKKNGIPTSPIITQETVDAAMASNPYGAMRELKVTLIVTIVPSTE